MRNRNKQLLAILCACMVGSAFAESAKEAELAAKQAEIVAKQADSRRITHSPGEDEPVIQSIEGIGQSLHATLQLRNGSTLDVSSGDVLPNGMKVVSIRSNEVIVATPQNRRLRLATGAPPATVYPQGTQRSMAQMAPLPAMPPSLPLSLSRGAAR